MENSLLTKKKIYDDEEALMPIPMGWRFMPTEEELVVSYLSSKVALRPLPAKIIKEVDAVEFYRHHPKNLVKESENYGGTEEELVVSYLSSKVALRPLPAKIIKEVDAIEFYRYHPKNLVGIESESYLFIHHDEYFHGTIRRKKPVGEGIGCWKSNGKEEAIFDVNGKVFARKIHYTFFNQKGRKTHWKMEEYRLLKKLRRDGDEWVVAKIRGA